MNGLTTKEVIESRKKYGTNQINSKEKSKEDSRMASEEARKTLEKARMTALIIITAPIWLPIAIVLSPLIIWFMVDIHKNGWHYGWYT